MKYWLSCLLLFCFLQNPYAQTELDQYNSQYVLAVQAYMGEASETNISRRALAAFQLYFYHHDGYRKDEADRYKADAKNSWHQLEESGDRNMALSATIGLGSIYYMEGYDVKRSLENIPVSDVEAYGKASKELNRLMNRAYEYLVKGDRQLPKLAKEILDELEEQGASNSRVSQVREQFYNDYSSILDTMTKLFSMSFEMDLYNAYKDRLLEVQQGNLFLKPYADLPDQLFFN